MAQREHINQLKADLKSAGRGHAAPAGRRRCSRRRPASACARSAAPAIASYLTGINLKGKRILVLIDRSASMMDEDLVSIIKLRNQNPALRRAAPKWRQTLDIADWLSTQFPPGSQFQMYGFNTERDAAGAGHARASGWIRPIRSCSRRPSTRCAAWRPRAAPA